MRGFLSLFTDSARELKQVRALTVTALLMALGREEQERLLKGEEK